MPTKSKKTVIKCDDIIIATINKKKCKCCNKYVISSLFGIKSNGEEYKSCLKCRDKDKRRPRRDQSCIHKKYGTTCRICNPIGHLTNIVRTRFYNVLGRGNGHKMEEYLGCSIEDYKNYLESKFEDWMTWDNYGEWNIDHITPIKYEKPSLDDIIKRLHYTNTQPLKATTNNSKSNIKVG